jgi:hypothetical protein
MRPVEVGEDLPPTQARAGVVVRELLGLFEQDVDGVDELVAAPGIGPDPCEFVGLGGADVAGVECLTDVGEIVDEARQLAQPVALRSGVVGVRLQPAVHRVVMIDDVDRAALPFGDDGSHLGLDPPPLQLELPEPVGQGRIVEFPERVDNGGQHEFMIPNKRTQTNM